MPKYQLYTKDFEDSEWEEKVTPQESSDLLVEIAKYEVNKDGAFSAKVVDTSSDEEVFLY